MKYTKEKLAELAKTVSGQVAVTESGTFMNEQQFSKFKGKAFKISDLISEVDSSKSGKEKAPSESGTEKVPSESGTEKEPSQSDK